jgi:hypothetical protein
MFFRNSGLGFIRKGCIGIWIAEEEETPLENRAILVAVALIATHFGHKDRSSIFYRVVAAGAINLGGQIVGRPGSQGMGESKRDVLAIVLRRGIRLVPDTQFPGIVATGAINAGMAGMFGRPAARVRIVTVAAARGLAMRAMTLRAFHRRMDFRFFLFLDDPKAMAPFMTLGA